jgi:alpha-mannosidase
VPGKPNPVAKAAVASGSTLDNGIVKVRIDEQTGGIVELRMQGLDQNFADTASGESLNDYRYFNGSDPANAKRNGAVKISVKENGPLVASLLIESDAPGCHRLWREIRLVAGQDTVEIINTLDKERLVAPNYYEAKESVNFAFPFAVPNGQVRLEVPYGVLRPDFEQIASACKNWFTVNRWADVANDQFGVTWISLDAPLVQVGGMTANLLNSQSNPDVWRKKVGPTQKLYSWAMNNHWGTNYRAYQDGPHVFRFLLRPHRQLDTAAASRVAIAASQPLQPTAARGPKAATSSRFSLSSPNILVTALKPSDDGKAMILRLWGASGRDESTAIQWSAPAPKRVWLSDTSEKALKPAGNTITVPAWGLVTLRAELAK